MGGGMMSPLFIWSSLPILQLEGGDRAFHHHVMSLMHPIAGDPIDRKASAAVSRLSPA
jgi:hypothetical protein